MYKSQAMPNTHADSVLTKALLRTADALSFTGKELSQVLGMSEATVTRLRNDNKLISPHTKEGELSLLLIRLYRSLNAILGDDNAKSRAWLQSYHHYFNETPFEHMQTITGLVNVVNYLDAMRGKL